MVPMWYSWTRRQQKLAFFAGSVLLTASAAAWFVSVVYAFIDPGITTAVRALSFTGAAVLVHRFSKKLEVD